MHVAALFGRFQALNWLIRYKFRGLVSVALEQRNNPLLETPLHLALSQVLATEDNEELNALEELIGQVESSGVLSLQNYLNETPMHRLAASGLNERARRKGLGTILTHEKKCHYPGKYIDHLGRTLLWHATCSGRVEEVRQLFETLPQDDHTGFVDNNTVIVNQSDNYGISPLHVACRFGYTEVVRTLLKAGAWPNCVTSDPGFSPAHYAALFNHAGCLELLIEYGADVCQSTESMDFVCKPIHLANVNNFSRVQEILVAAGSSQYDLACTHHIINNDHASGCADGTTELYPAATDASLRLALYKIPTKPDSPQHPAGEEVLGEGTLFDGLQSPVTARARFQEGVKSLVQSDSDSGREASAWKYFV
ncbi:ankyrin repeat-containing domain protein [Apiospora hydei]|uniref:Ankyrin repeat-containing domain protein n=1 Tax=Apiospora hydei TaxID=1337664 RepID=A0ABR1V1L2_9PEZI